MQEHEVEIGSVDELPGAEPADANTGYVLNGTLQKAGGTLRLSTQLIDRTNGQQVWGNSFERSAGSKRDRTR